MQQVLSFGLWASVGKLAKKSPRLAAIAYVSTSQLVTFGKGDLLVVDASDASVRSGATSAAALEAFVRLGADVVSLPGLHAKVLTLGETAVIGSANLSMSSQNDLIEAAVVTDSASVVSGIKSLVFQLAEAGTRVDGSFLERIKAIHVVRTPRFGGKRQSTLRLDKLGNSMWVVGVRELADDAFEYEDAIADSGMDEAEQKRTYRNSDVNWIRFTGAGKFRSNAKSGDSVIQVWKPLGRSAVAVYPPATILRRQDEGAGRTRFYLEERAKSASMALTMPRFRSFLQQLGFRARVGTSSERQMETLLADAIAGGWKAAAGKGRR